MAADGLPQGFQLDAAAEPDAPVASAPPSGFQLDDEKYGSLPQQALAAVEGVGQGVLGPIAPLVERGQGISSADIRGRAAANPWTHGISEAAGFAGSALIPALGESNLASKVGQVGERVAAAVLPEATTTLAKIAQSGVKTGAEMAALQTSDEISKLVTEDPNQSIGSAAINVGLSGILGGAGGAVVGSVSPLWKKTLNKLGVEKLASDYMGETKFLTENPDLVQGASSEINDRIASTDQIMRGGLKGKLVAALTKDVTPEQVSGHVEQILKSIESAPAALKKEPIFQEAVEDWKNKVIPKEQPIDPITLQPAGEAPSIPSAGDVFQATENLKRQLQEWGQYNKALVPIAERPFRDASQSLARGLKESLEDSKVWGAAADAQRAYNKAISPLFDIQKEFLGKFTSKEFGEKVADPTKINTYLNQADKSKAGLKTNYVKNYLDQTQKAADAINQSYLENGLEQPLEEKLNPTPVLNHSLNTEATAGVNLARWAKRGGAAGMGANVAGHVAAEAVGGGLGFLVGHPLAGAWMGDKVLKPVFAALAKPLAEKAINTEAAKGAVDYVGNVIKGQKLLSESVQNFFKYGAEVIPKHLIPNAASRDNLEKSIEYASNPNYAMNVGGNLGHYLPDHATSATATAATAANFLKSLKPVQIQQSPLDKPSKPDPVKQQQYNRALDVAQQPLTVLQHAKKGTLQPIDVQTLSTLYPNLKKRLVSDIYSEMIKAKSDGNQIPYKQRVSLSMLMGQPMDSTMTQMNMATIMGANGQRGPSPQQVPQGKQKRVSQSTARTMDKTNKLYATPDQARAASRTAGSS